MSATEDTKIESNKVRYGSPGALETEYTYSEHARISFNVQPRKRKKKRKKTDLHNRPEWYPTRYHFAHSKGNKRTKKVDSGTEEIARINDITEKNGDSNATENREYSNTTEMENIKVEKQQSASIGGLNPSLGYHEDESLELPTTPPHSARFTENGTVKTNRSSIPTLPDIKPHGQGVYVVKPFQVTNGRQPEQIKYGFSARPTASGLTDPWVDLNMDNSVLPKIQDRLVTHAEPSSPRSVKKFRKKKDVLEGSTMLPKFPVIEMPNSEYVNRALYYNELHGIRDQLDKRKMYNRRQNREDVDYKRTKQDFYRMELDKIHDFDEIKQTRMRDMYYSYLQNTPGSSKAVKECVKKIG